jgi:phosphatidylglycerol:prolipoprotein diacylglycerol transferase
VISLTYCLAVIWAFQRAPAAEKALALDVCLAIMLGGLLGARLTHVFYENWDYYKLSPLEIFKVWQGGFVFDGGFVGAVAAVWILMRLRSQSFLKWGDFFAPILAFGYALGRVGCFLNGCCFGKLCDLPWAIQFHQPGLPSGARHPTQLYAVFWEIAVLALILWLERLRSRRATAFPAGAFFFLWLSLHASGRLVMEFFRDDYRGPDLLGLSIATWWALAMILVSFLFMTRRTVFRRALR